MVPNPLTWLSQVRHRLDRARGRRRAPPVPTGALGEYVEGVPSAQNAIDAVPGWNQAFPPEMGLRAGDAHMYFDPRILWCVEQFGDVAGTTILELGPLEGWHSYMFECRGVGLLHAVEANKASFLRCLVVKEILGMTRVKFMLGNFMAWLEAPGPRYDLAVASGVLYHMRDPVRLIELLAARADAIFLWTHYFDETAMPPGDPRRNAFDETVETRTLGDVAVRLHRRSYYWAWVDPRFCGGMYDQHYWIEKEHIVAILARLGFDDVRIAHDEPAHPNGPSCSVFARRSRPEAAPAAA